MKVICISVWDVRKCFRLNCLNLFYTWGHEKFLDSGKTIDPLPPGSYDYVSHHAQLTFCV